MSLTNAYLVSTRNLDSVINAMLTAKAPERFTFKFLEGLGFKSSNDRLYINVFKALGFLDDNGTPTERYFRFLDQGIYKEVLAEGIRSAYEDLFSININAQTLSTDDVKNKLKTLTQGQKSDKVISLMATTFSALCGLADWSKKSSRPVVEENSVKIEPQTQSTEKIENKLEEKAVLRHEYGKMEFHYDIQLHLPETRDEAVYDAIFSSLKKHLM